MHIRKATFNMKVAFLYTSQNKHQEPQIPLHLLQVKFATLVN